jgi:DNA-binding response OmpR family regulator
MPDTRILVVEDEPALRNLLMESLQKAGFHAYGAGQSAEALEIFDNLSLDLVLVDVLMPDMDGFALCAELRKRSDVPVILLTSLHDPEDVVYGFGVGADDLVIKPFQFRELEVRIQAVLRRVAWSQKLSGLPVLVQGDAILDSTTREIQLAGRRIHLTPIEFQLLYHLMNNATHPIHEKELFQAVWGYEFSGDAGIVEVAVRHLRERIEPDPDQPQYILNAGESAYQFNIPAHSPPPA